MFVRLSLWMVFASVGLVIDGLVLERRDLRKAFVKCRTKPQGALVQCLVDQDVGLNHTQAQAFLAGLDSAYNKAFNACIAIVEQAAGAGNITCLGPIVQRFLVLEVNGLQQNISACYSPPLTSEQLDAIMAALSTQKSRLGHALQALIANYNSPSSSKRTFLFHLLQSVLNDNVLS